MCIVQSLVENKADVNIKENNGVSCFTNRTELTRVPYEVCFNWPTSCVIRVNVSLSPSEDSP